jgi:hypothetical protein
VGCSFSDLPMNNTQAAAIIGLTGRSRPTERISAHKARDFGRQTPGEIMTKPQDRQRPTGLMVGQPFNPYRLFTGIFIPEALVRSKLVSPGAKMAYGRLARYAGKDGRCFPAVSNLALEIGIGARQAQKYLAELEKAKLIRRRIRFSDRAQASNSIEFLWHPLFQDRVNDPSGEGVNDPSPGGVNDRSPKESQIEESQLYKENGGLEHHGVPLNESNISKADYSFASAKPAEGSEHVRSLPARKPTSKPPCYAVRGCQFGDDTASLQFACNLCSELRVPFRPRGQMIAGRKPVSFLAVAPAISEHEIVAQVHRISSPGDEVIDARCRWRKWCVTVKHRPRFRRAMALGFGRAADLGAKFLGRRNVLIA